jgi:hypothetical protein
LGTLDVHQLSSRASNTIAFLPTIEDQGQKHALVPSPLDSLSPTNATPNALTMEEKVLCDKQNDPTNFDVGEYLVAFDAKTRTQDVGLAT